MALEVYLSHSLAYLKITFNRDILDVQICAIKSGRRFKELNKIRAWRGKVLFTCVGSHQLLDFVFAHFQVGSGFNMTCISSAFDKRRARSFIVFQNGRGWAAPD